jgi:hypothetical protein
MAHLAPTRAEARNRMVASQLADLSSLHSDIKSPTFATIRSCSASRGTGCLFLAVRSATTRPLCHRRPKHL